MENEQYLHIECNVVGNLCCDMVLGIPFLQMVNLYIDWETFWVKFKDGSTIQAVPVEHGGQRPPVCKISAKTVVRLAKKPDIMVWFGLNRDDSNVQNGLLASTEVSSDPMAAASQQIQQLLREYSGVFEAPRAQSPHQVTHCIHLVDESLPHLRQCVYRTLPAELAKSRRQIQEMLTKGWIRPSCSPYGALLLFVRKRTSELQMCIDYRMLNKQTRLDKFPIPRIDDLLDCLSSATMFSKIDPTNAYHQILIEDLHQYKTEFQTSFGLYEWVVLALGLCNAPETFQYLMHNVFSDALHDFGTMYLDDILIFLKNEEEHLEHIQFVLEKLRTHNFKAKIKKSGFGLEAVEYLGHIVSQGNMSIDPAKVAAVADWPEPVDVKQLQSFLGFANQYNRFIRRFAHIAAPLTELLAKGVQFVCGKAQRDAFNDLKAYLISALVLQLPNFDLDFILETDASAFALY